MKPSIIILALIGNLQFLLATPTSFEEVRFCSGEQLENNFLASRIYGDWILDFATSQRLGNDSADVNENENVAMTTSFTENLDALGALDSAKLSERLGTAHGCIYAAGNESNRLTVNGETYWETNSHFILIAHNGNMLLVHFQAGGGVLGGFALTNLARGKDPSQDILFLAKKNGLTFAFTRSSRE